MTYDNFSLNCWSLSSVKIFFLGIYSSNCLTDRTSFVLWEVESSGLNYLQAAQLFSVGCNFRPRSVFPIMEASWGGSSNFHSLNWLKTNVLSESIFKIHNFWSWSHRDFSKVCQHISLKCLRALVLEQSCNVWPVIAGLKVSESW